MEMNTEKQRQEQENRKPSADDAESRLNDQDPGERQKENQNQQKDDPSGLAERVQTLFGHRVCSLHGDADCLLENHSLGVFGLNGEAAHSAGHCY